MPLPLLLAPLPPLRVVLKLSQSLMITLPLPMLQPFPPFPLLLMLSLVMVLLLGHQAMPMSMLPRLLSLGPDGGSQTGYGFGSVTVHVLAVAFTGSMGSRSRFERYACLVDATGFNYYTITILATFAYVAAYSTG